MDNPAAQKTTVNVKNVEVDAWDIARKQAAKNDESLGSIVSRALYQMGKTDLLEPGNASGSSANLNGRAANPGTDLPTLLHAAAALVQATGGSLDVVTGLKSLLNERVREERGLPPTRRRKTLLLNGKASANLLSETGNPGGSPPLLVSAGHG